MSGRRILSLWLPRLSTDRLAREGAGPAGEAAAEGRPVATVTRTGGALVVAAVDAAAEAAGLAPGLGFAEARALVPALAVDAHDPDADRALLLKVADLCDRYTPLVAVSGPDGLFLDVTGCPHLFGGEAALRADLLDRLARAGLSARAAVAATPGAAFALARNGERPPVLAEGGERAALAPLPVACLRLAPDVVSVLARLGIRTVGDLLEQPRAGLARRFGAEPLARLDAALGAADEPVSPRLPAPALIVERRFSEPVFCIEAVSAALAAMAEGLAESLLARGEGARRLAVSLFHADGTVHRLEAGASRPVAAAGPIAAVLAPRLEALSARLETDSGIDLLRLAALETGPAAPEQQGFDGTAAAEADLARLVDTLSARLGADAVRRLVPRDTHHPSLACEARPALAGEGAPWPAPAADPDAPAEPPDRPLRLFDRPEPVEAIATVPDGPPVRFRWRKVSYEVAAAEGPERIAAEWWRDGHPARTRDYFRVEDVDGRRFWLFRHGLYERETDRPAWFVHGLFP